MGLFGRAAFGHDTQPITLNEMSFLRLIYIAIESNNLLFIGVVSSKKSIENMENGNQFFCYLITNSLLHEVKKRITKINYDKIGSGFFFFFLFSHLVEKVCHRIIL